MSKKNCVLAVGTVLLALPPGSAEAVRIDYTIDAGVEHNDNVTLVDGAPVSQNILRTGLGFLATEDTSTLQLRVEGRAEYRNHEDDLYSDGVEGELGALANWFAIPDRLSITAENRLELQAINPFAEDTPDNRQQVNVFSIGPNLYFMRGSTFQGQLEMRYIDSRAEETEEFNSQRIGLAARAFKEFDESRRASINVQSQDVDFDDDAFARDHRRDDLFARYEHGFNILSLSLDAGWSRVSFDDGDDHSAPLLRAGLTWRPSERSRFSLDVVDQYSDAATTFLGGVQAPGGIPTSVLIGTDIITAAVYEERSATAGYTYLGDVTTFGASAYARQLDYIDAADPDEDREGVALDLGRTLRPTLSLGLHYSSERIRYDLVDGRFRTTRYGFALTKQWSRRWSSSLAVEHNRWENPVLGSDVDQTLVYLSIAYSNH